MSSLSDFLVTFWILINCQHLLDDKMFYHTIHVCIYGHFLDLSFIFDRMMRYLMALILVIWKGLFPILLLRLTKKRSLFETVGCWVRSNSAERGKGEKILSLFISESANVFNRSWCRISHFIYLTSMSKCNVLFSPMSKLFMLLS